MRAQRWLACLAVVCVCGICRVSAATDEPMTTTVYPITFGEPEALLEIARSVVGDQGQVAMDSASGRLIIATTPSRHQELAAILIPPAPMPVNIRIDVDFQSVGAHRRDEISIRPRGNVVVGPGGTSGSIVLNPTLDSTRSESSGMTRQSLLVANGRSGSLRVGEEVPYLDWFMEYGWHRGYIRQSIQWQSVGSFLAVQPTVLADGRTIRIVLTPELRGLVNGNPYHVAFTELATEVVVLDGETMNVGGGSNQRDFYDRFLVGFRRGDSTESLNIRVCPRIQSPGTAPR